jgi:hypothetical protein
MQDNILLKCIKKISKYIKKIFHKLNLNIILLFEIYNINLHINNLLIIKKNKTNVKLE